MDSLRLSPSPPASCCCDHSPFWAARGGGGAGGEPVERRLRGVSPKLLCEASSRAAAKPSRAAAPAVWQHGVACEQRPSSVDAWTARAVWQHGVAFEHRGPSAVDARRWGSAEEEEEEASLMVKMAEKRRRAGRGAVGGALRAAGEEEASPRAKMAEKRRGGGSSVGGALRAAGEEEAEASPMAEMVEKRRGGWSCVSREGGEGAAEMAEKSGGGGDEEDDDDKAREECGVVGIYGEGDGEASRLCYLALHALQHRGQEGAGIVSASGGDGVLRCTTGLGLVADVFDPAKLAQLPGGSAIGHVRYATAGASVLRNVQPFVAALRSGSLALAHNGNLVNYRLLRSQLELRGSIFNTSSDTEAILHLIATSPDGPLLSRIVHACEQIDGAFSLVFLSDDKLVAVRDPHGFRPLVMGRRRNGAVVFASETCALDLIEAAYEREVNPGEVVVVDQDGISCSYLLSQKRRQACVFEHIYFSMPNSIVFGRSVYHSRYAFGEILAEEAPVDCDVVIAVPDSGVVAALGYAAKAKVPFQQGLIRSHYVGRTFIEPSQKIRDFGVKLKLAPVQAVLKGKRVVVVDDSIVRGTTSSKIVRLIKEAGASEVHMRIASPPIIGSCYYGVDTPSREELISYKMSVEDTRRFIGADSLAFLPLERLRGMLGSEAPTFCDACFSGAYAVPPLDLLKDEEEKMVAKSIAENLDAVVETRLLGNAWSQGVEPFHLPHKSREPAGVA